MYKKDPRNKQDISTKVIRQRRMIAKKAVIKAVEQIFNTEDVPEGYSIDDIYATDHNDRKWGWWFYLTAKGSKTTIFRVTYSNASDTIQVSVHPRECVFEVSV